MEQKLDIALLASGKLGGLILNQLIKGQYSISAVFTDINSTEISKTCIESDIPVFVGNPRNGKANSFMQEYKVDVVASINYLFLIEHDLISWPSKIAFNIHGSLLPKYRGRTPHVWAIINNEKYTGVTVHKIDEGCDTGAIIRQEKVKIEEDDTGTSILQKYEDIYPNLVVDTLKSIENNTIELKEQDERKATYFGKRTPTDGLINWSWQKERIRNWVRAQAYPYPGAFTFYGKEKFIIDQVTFDDFGFHESTENGKILTTDPIRVKTPNGVLRIDSHRNNTIKLSSDKIFFQIC